MIDYIIYNTSSGEILKVIRVLSEDLASANTPSGYSYLEGTADISTQKISSGLIVSKSSSEETTFNNEVLSRDAERKRNNLLLNSDYLQTVDVNLSLSDSARSNWQNYRQALRDVPAQAGYPSNITWPTKPT